MRNSHYLLAFPIVLFIGFVLWTQKNDGEVIPTNSVRIIAEKAYKETDKKNLNTPPEIVLKKGDFHFFEQEHTCHVQAKESRIFPNAKKTECTNIVCTLKTKNDLATLRASRAYINQSDKIIFFPGTIIETFKDWSGTKENTTYNAKKQIVSAHKTTLQSKKHNIFTKSDNSIVDIKNESVSLHGNVMTLFTSNN
jgi:hypothetical protein